MTAAAFCVGVLHSGRHEAGFNYWLLAGVARLGRVLQAERSEHGGYR